MSCPAFGIPLCGGRFYFMSLINELINDGYLKIPEIIQAFRIIKRQDFVLVDDRGQAEADLPLGIGYGQTISQPATVAFMLEKLKPKSGEKILDIGCGSGWTTALLAQIVGGRGRVYGLERIEALTDFAIANVNKYNFIKNRVVHIIGSDGFFGLSEFSPFDKIIASAAADEIPEAWLRQLKIGGRLIAPIGENLKSQSLTVAEKITDQEFKIKKYPGFIFVPLVKN